MTSATRRSPRPGAPGAVPDDRDCARDAHGLAGPVSVAFSPTGGLLAVADSNANEVNMYSVSFAGGLTGVAAAHTGGEPSVGRVQPERRPARDSQLRR